MSWEDLQCQPSFPTWSYRVSVPVEIDCTMYELYIRSKVWTCSIFLTFIHFSIVYTLCYYRQCTFIPNDIKEEYVMLKTAKGISRGRKHYWVTSALKRGLCNGERGIVVSSSEGNWSPSFYMIHRLCLWSWLSWIRSVVSVDDTSVEDSIRISILIICTILS